MDKRIFNQFRDIVYKESGISLSDKKEQLVSARIGKRIRALKLTGQKEYLDFLTNDRGGNELTEFLDVISTNLTSFFREPDHFDTLKELFKDWWDKGQSRFRFWSAASSTGEEPYSMAVSLLEVLNGRPMDIKILATDISTRTLRHCQRGIYEEKRLETLPLHQREKYFDTLQDNGKIVYQAKDNLKKLISFRHFNLSKFPYPMKGPLDIIFCRNVMIYFDNDLKEKLVKEFYRLLKPGGYLMIGHSESLTGLSSGSIFKNVRPSVYLKRKHLISKGNFCMKILVADDEATTLKLLEKVLCKWGHEVQVARDGNEAWDIINSETTPPLLLLDWMMPGYDGIELCQMTQKSRKSFIYIILMTANENRGSLQTALDAGAHIFIPKPVSLPELKSHISVGQRLVDYDKQLRNQNQHLEELAEQRAQELIHADRLATLGTLTAGIAHEINNPSSFISGNAQTLEKFWTVIDPLLEKNSETAENQEQLKFIKEEVPKVIQGIKEGVRRISAITQGLKNYSRKDKGELEDVNILHIINEALLICHNKLKTQVQVTCQLDENLPLIKSNAQQLEQVFINLINNAADAMEAHNGGKINIFSKQEANNVLVFIEDNGPGIQEKLLKKIFDPFFTTKEVGKGTGLGLSICQRILNNLGGHLSVENLTTGGAKFTINLALKGAENVH